MNQETPGSPLPSIAAAEPARALTWMDVWVSAITEPSSRTFENILRDPGASARRAYGWVFFSSLFGFFISFLLQIVLNKEVLDTLGVDPTAPLALGIFGGILLCAGPLASLFAVIGVIINSGLTQWIATGLGGKGNFSQLVYAVAAFTAPITLISSFVAAIPLVNLISIFLGLYALVLNIIAIKAANRFGYGSAIVTLLLLWVGAAVVMAFIVAMTLVLFGPAIGDIFQNIQNELMRSINL
jgi:hypothetical protein